MFSLTVVPKNFPRLARWSLAHCEIVYQPAIEIIEFSQRSTDRFTPPFLGYRVQRSNEVKPFSSLKLLLTGGDQIRKGPVRVERVLARTWKTDCCLDRSKGQRIQAFPRR